MRPSPVSRSPDHLMVSSWLPHGYLMVTLCSPLLATSWPPHGHLRVMSSHAVHAGRGLYNRPSALHTIPFSPSFLLFSSLLGQPPLLVTATWQRQHKELGAKRLLEARHTTRSSTGYGPQPTPNSAPTKEVNVKAANLSRPSHQSSPTQEPPDDHPDGCILEDPSRLLDDPRAS